ncbi:unnamed protein product [Heterobilharzia americana]|nr:unnamed protein product [Heterobilharzia americana]
MPCFFFCFWRLFSNRLKEKNAEILRKMFHYITSADDATNKQFYWGFHYMETSRLNVNCVIQEIYFALLNESADSANFLENLKNELFKSREQQKSSHSKIIGIKRSGQVKTNSEFADLTLETVTHTTNHNVPQSSKSKILGEDHKFSQTQIQLILRMEGIRDWLVLVNSCGLLDELDPPLPPIFSLEKHIRVGSGTLTVLV